MKKISIFLALILSISLIMPVCSITVFADSTKYISDIKLEAGENAKDKLEKDGYNVFTYGLNINDNSTDPKAKLFLGCKYTADASAAIRDLVVSSSNTSQLTFNNMKYSPVSSLSLNNGVSGKNLYLYQTKEKNAGDPIVDLSASIYKSGSADPELMGKPIFGDGSRTVLNTDKAPANFEEGVGTGALYIGMVTSPMVKPYICNIHVASGGENDSLRTLAGFSCTRYAQISDKVYLGYSNTNNLQEAVRNIMFYESEEKTVKTKNAEYSKVDSYKSDNKYCLYTSTSESEGSPIFGVLYYPKSDDKTSIIAGKTYSDWVDILYKSKNSDSSSMLLDDSGYLALKKNNSDTVALRLKGYSTVSDAKEFDLMLVRDAKDKNMIPDFSEDIKVNVGEEYAEPVAGDANALTDDKVEIMKNNPDMEPGLDQNNEVASVFGYTDYALMVGAFILAFALGYFLVRKFKIKKIKKYL